jgi:hypothetical protein
MTERFSPRRIRRSGKPVTLLLGDPGNVLPTLPPGSADCVVTSPGGFHSGDLHTTDQPSAAGDLDRMRAVFGEVQRILADDGTLWLHLADQYSPSPEHAEAPRQYGEQTPGASSPPGPGSTLPAGSLLGLPWRIALALQADGWILRNSIIWRTASRVPGIAPDRLTCTHEYVFLLVKQPHYWFDLDALREPLRHPEVAAQPPPVGGRQGAAGCIGGSARRRSGRHARNPKHRSTEAFCGSLPGAHLLPTGRRHTAAHAHGRNPGDVWTAPEAGCASPLSDAVPSSLPMRCIVAGCRPGGMVLDPYSGAGQTGLAALHLGRAYTGIEANRAQHRLAEARLSQAAPHAPGYERGPDGARTGERGR